MVATLSGVLVAIATKTPLKVATIINRSYLEGLGNYE